MNKLKHIYYWIFKAKKGGLIHEEPDPRNFDMGIFGFFEYKPKHTRTNNRDKIKWTKDQKYKNNCVFQSITVQDECTEKKATNSKINY